jgi:hypothetical protein
MRILALGILVVALGGCATAAEQEVTRIKDTSQRARAVTDSCWSRAWAQDGFVALSNRLAMKYSVPPTLAQRSDAGKPTPEERQVLSDLHRDWLTRCRKAAIHGAVAMLAASHRPMMRYAEREDAIYAGLVQGRLTWGDANTQLAAIRSETDNAIYEVVSKADQDLRRQHAYEIGRRMEAIRALGEALTELGNQQIEAERRRQQQQQQSTPRQTICQNHGGYLSCTTY